MAMTNLAGGYSGPTGGASNLNPYAAIFNDPQFLALLQQLFQGGQFPSGIPPQPRPQQIPPPPGLTGGGGIGVIQPPPQINPRMQGDMPPRPGMTGLGGRPGAAGMGSRVITPPLRQPGTPNPIPPPGLTGGGSNFVPPPRIGGGGMGSMNTGNPIPGHWTGLGADMGGIVPVTKLGMSGSGTYNPYDNR